MTIVENRDDNMITIYTEEIDLATNKHFYIFGKNDLRYLFKKDGDVLFDDGLHYIYYKGKFHLTDDTKNHVYDWYCAYIYLNKRGNDDE